MLGEAPGHKAVLLRGTGETGKLRSGDSAMEQGGLRGNGDAGVAVVGAQGLRGYQIKEAAGVFGRACHERKVGEDCGRDGRNTEETDRGTAQRDPGLWAKLLEGEDAQGGWPVGLAGLVGSTHR